MPRYALILLCLCGCRFQVHEHSAWLSDYGLVTAETDLKQSELEITPKIERITIRLSADAKAGSAEWTLRDPNGETMWKHRIEGQSRIEETVHLPVRAGTWTFRRELDDFTGRHHLRLSAVGDGRLDVTVVPAPLD
jgi:hypothetical protein